MISRKLVTDIIEVIELNYKEKITKKIDEKIEIIEHLPSDEQVAVLDRFFHGRRISDNAFFREMHSDVIKFLLKGFELFSFLPGESIYHANMPSNKRSQPSSQSTSSSKEESTASSRRVYASRRT